MNPTCAQLEELQTKAETVRPSLDVRRPLFIEFAGTPKSGKSTCIDAVNHFFRRIGFKVLAPTEGASKRTPYFLKDDLVSFNAWSATYALTHILEGRYSTDKYHLVIMDRGLFDALAWFELLKQRKDITPDDCAAIQKFLLIGHWRELVDMIFLFQTDPETSLKRENSDKLINEPGTAMNPKFLKSLNAAYDETQQKFTEKFKSLYTINTAKESLSTPQSTAFEVAKAIVNRLSSNAE